jgi:hypothetical protein
MLRDGAMTFGRWLLAAAIFALPSYTLAQVRGGVQSGVRGVITKLGPARVLLPPFLLTALAGGHNHLELPALSASSAVKKTLVCINHRRE